jgi:hypothetical protein
MTVMGENERAALRRLADALAEDILKATDEEVLAEVVELYGDPVKVAAETRRALGEAVAASGKEKLRAARAAVNSLNTRQLKAVRLSPVEARRCLAEVLAGDPDTSRKLTLAARKGPELSDEDVIGMVDDLMALGVLPYPDKPDGAS